MTKKYEIYWTLGIINNNLQGFCDWLNGHGDFDLHTECLDDTSTIGKDKRPNHITDYGRGYHQAISDVWDKLKPEATKKQIK